MAKMVKMVNRDQLCNKPSGQYTEHPHSRDLLFDRISNYWILSTIFPTMFSAILGIDLGAFDSPAIVRHSQKLKHKKKKKEKDKEQQKQINLID